MVDIAEIEVRGGDGGPGAVSFRREKFVPFGGPDGGAGGDGGSVILVADPSVKSLRAIRFKRRFIAVSGSNGEGRKKSGKSGDDIVVHLPLGTVVSYKEDDQDVFIADLSKPGQRLVVARGGKGGRGNESFATSIRQVPRLAEKGEPGEHRKVKLALKIIAEVGIIGKPNAGKSTLLTAATAAHPKVANYPFTTLEPELGVSDLSYRPVVLAEIPGLIEGASRGLGLGHNFLQHAERTKVFIHLIDGSSESPLDDLKQVDEELALYKQELADKPQLVAVNKIDLPEVKERMTKLKRQLARRGDQLFFISAAAGEGIAELIKEAVKVVDQVEEAERVKIEAEAPDEVVFRPRPDSRRVEVSREDGAFRVSSPKVERLVVMADLGNVEARMYLRQQFSRLGVTKALTKAGIQPGDKVRFGNVEMEWEE